MVGYGKNMLDLRISNRGAVLNLLYSKGGMSRKEIAARLNLTPPAISYITNELIAEEVLVESGAIEGSNRMGRREIVLEINLNKFKTISANIATRDVSIACADLAGSIFYRKRMRFDEEDDGKKIIDTICDYILEYINSLGQLERRYIIGAGVGVKGVYDIEKGVSVKSFGLWEPNVHVRDIMQKRLGMRVLVDNNVRCVANGEMLFSHNEDIHSMLFIKHGPLIGGAFVLENNLYHGHSYHAMEIGHVVVDPMGSVCRCGKRGCLETVVGFDAIGKSLELQYSAAALPILYEQTGGDKSKISMQTIMQSFDHGELIVTEMLNRSLEYMALALVNAVEMLNPQLIMLYGEPFESKKYFNLLKNKMEKINKGEIDIMVRTSSRNLQLDDLGCASIIIKDFLDSGAIFTAISRDFNRENTV